MTSERHFKIWSMRWHTKYFIQSESMLLLKLNYQGKVLEKDNRHTHQRTYKNQNNTCIETKVKNKKQNILYAFFYSNLSYYLLWRLRYFFLNFRDGRIVHYHGILRTMIILLHSFFLWIGSGYLMFLLKTG